MEVYFRNSTLDRPSQMKVEVILESFLILESSTGQMVQMKGHINTAESELL